MSTTNRQWLINGNPRGRAIEPDDFLLHEAELTPLAEGHVRVQVDVLGFDPALKGQMENVAGYTSGNAVGDVMPGSGIGTVVESRSASIKVGALVLGRLGWQEMADVPAKSLQVLPETANATQWLGPLGTTGLTAYFGLLKVGQPEPGDRVAVSGAAGAVGSMVGQIARIMGCDTVGIAGGAQKCAWLVDEVGYDAAIDYKNDPVKARLREECPGGINVYFDNVGGPTLNDALACIANFARVVICGGIARYEQAKLPDGPANYFNVVFRQARMEGFLLRGYEAETELARDRIARWIAEGKIVYREDVQHGFENIPSTLMRLFSGANFGKQLLKL